MNIDPVSASTVAALANTPGLAIFEPIKRPQRPSLLLPFQIPLFKS